MASDEEGRERRRYRRIHAPIYCRPAGLKLMSKRQEAVDVSRGGVRIYSDEAMKVGDRLTLELFVEGGGEEVVFQAMVAWIEKLPKGAVARYDVGLKFLHLDARAEALLNTVLGESE
jgi:c-di-GMP-binding flagellar brake protein YcgR